MKINPGQFVVERDTNRIGTFLRNEEMNWVTVAFDGKEELLGRDEVQVASSRDIERHQIDLEWNEVLRLVRERKCSE